MTEDQLSNAAKAALHERVKELTCLYGIAQIAGRPGTSLEEVLQEIVEHLPDAWQYPEIASARIIFDGVSYSAEGFLDSGPKQAADISVRGAARGTVEIVYLEQRPELDEGPFLKEERDLIDEVARQIGLIIERRQAEQDRLRLQDQLRHADRLATIGMLAAGVAHELNEPLGNILGFAQLSKKCADVPAAVMADIEKIELASLNAREITRKLLVFARQSPPNKQPVSLNRIVEDGLGFFETRCARQGIEVVRVLAPGLPDITADPSQLNQVLVNLVVNALQAMPAGGRLTVRTETTDDHVLLIVEDTGSGMSEDVVEQIFLPFFTTKDVGQGTGLGLPVVHGIIASHGGSIEVKSRVSRGTRFEIRMPIRGPQESEEGA